MIIDARGHRCPVPTLKLRKALATLPPGSQAVLLADDPMARIDAPHLMGQLGGRTVSIEEADGALRITVETAAAPPG